MDSNKPPGYGDKLSPYGRSLMRSMGGGTLSLKLDPRAAKFWGVEHPTSLLNLLSDEEMIMAATNLPLSVVSQHEIMLERACPEGRPSRQDRRVRIAFWEEYEKAASTLDPMDLELVVSGTGVLHWSAYKEGLLSDQTMLAWFLTPPANYRVQMKEAMELGLSRLVEIMQLPLTDPSGKIRADIGALILQAYKLVDLRNHGAIAQKIVQLTADAGQVPDNGTMAPDEIDKKLAELEAKLRGDPPKHEPLNREPRDVVSEVVSDPKPSSK